MYIELMTGDNFNMVHLTSTYTGIFEFVYRSLLLFFRQLSQRLMGQPPDPVNTATRVLRWV